jgi:hypothetical protein
VARRSDTPIFWFARTRGGRTGVGGRRAGGFALLERQELLGFGEKPERVLCLRVDLEEAAAGHAHPEDRRVDFKAHHGADEGGVLRPGGLVHLHALAFDVLLEVGQHGVVHGEVPSRRAHAAALDACRCRRRTSA